ncbi:hypothetical protein [Micromonospora lupini]|uniref:Uncharacterized protein n=1 Tax=Micromonospora lupini str. Lupac 08 TaxID=1150864 RepID=I0L8H3_9ACTN|nr:hypothetical protein [Micromonospora lupini]CCH20120.1 conserved hypothetical protein [Micromonospora lupini str. Lupac 08]
MDTSPAPARGPSPDATRAGNALRTGGPTSETDGHTPETDDTDTDSAGPSRASRRRRTVLLLLALTAVTSATALVAGLLSWAPDPPTPARPLTVTEAERLAAMRVTNLRDLRAGVHVTAGAGASRTDLVGWVDWSRPLLYLDVGGPGAGAERGLLQSAGPVLVTRPDPAAVPTPAAPPLVPPADRWRLHRLTPGAGLAPVLDLLLGLAADRPDPSPAMDGGDARWVARDVVAAGPVDVLQAPLPAVTPPTPARAATAGTAATGPDGSTRYWLDRDGRLHKLVTRLPGVGPVTVLLNRIDRPTLRPVDALGGRPGLPRALTDAEQRRLDRLPARLRGQGGATLTLTAPVGTDTNLRGAGWLSWAARTAYVAVADLGVPDRRTLLHRDAAGLSRTDVPAEAGGGGAAETPGRPPFPVPAGSWRPTRAPRDDLDLLVDAAVAAAGPVAQRGAAVRVREDLVAGRTVDVVEFRPGDARLRYWIDRDGSLRRVELHTGPGAWAQVDLSPAVVPRLGPPPRATPPSGAPRR